jgi:hypothetical protein
MQGAPTASLDSTSRLSALRQFGEAHTEKWRAALESSRVTRLVSRSIEMKTRLFFLSSALLIAMSGSAVAQDSQQDIQQYSQPQARPSGQAGVLHDANTSAQATSDTSYGGMPDTRSATSSMSRPRQCVGGSVQCDVFFGH